MSLRGIYTRQRRSLCFLCRSIKLRILLRGGNVANKYIIAQSNAANKYIIAQSMWQSEPGSLNVLYFSDEFDNLTNVLISA